VQKIIEIGSSLLKLFNIKLMTFFETSCIWNTWIVKWPMIGIRWDKNQLSSNVLGGRAGCRLRMSAPTWWLISRSDNLALIWSSSTTVGSAESFLYYTAGPLCHLQKQITTSRLGPLLLCLTPRRCLTLSSCALWWSWMAVCPDLTL